MVDNSSEFMASTMPVSTNTGLQHFDAIMICGYGGPRRTEDVLPFMRNATKGRGVPDSRLSEVGKHYHKFGGVSPINAHLGALRRALEAELRARGIDTEVVVGNRNWTPYFYDTLCDLAGQGKTRILCVFAAAYICYSCCRQYREDLAKAAAELAELDINLSFDKIRAFYNTAGFITANAELLAAAIQSATEVPAQERHISFVTHSIPESMESCSGTINGGPSYRQQHLEVCAEVIAQTEALLNISGPTEQLSWDLSYCSRSGPPQVRWLEPDINDRLTELPAQGIKQVFVSPLGFICDHMEVLYDLDTEAAETATELGMEYYRTATVGIQEKFVSALADLVLERDDRLDLSKAKWGKPVLPYLWPAWPKADEQLVKPNASPLPAVMQVE